MVFLVSYIISTSINPKFFFSLRQVSNDQSMNRLDWLPMNPLLIACFVATGGLILYLIFIGIGFGGVSQNRKAQGLDKDENN